MTSRTKKLLWVSAASLLIVAVGAVLWTRRFHRYTPVEAVLDLQAAAKARNAPRPVERFLEARYGSLAEPANRQRAFVDFFNIGHIEGMNIIVNHLGKGDKQVRINEMAQWIAEYRRTMSPEEKTALGAYMRSDAGRSSLQQATGQYLAKDGYFRASTAPVITELMTTLATVGRP
jgi:hypothetical protein